MGNDRSIMKACLLCLLLALPAAAAAETLSFKEARTLMLRGNPEALSAALDAEAAGFRLRSARGALFPSFSASASYSRSGTQGFAPGDSYSYGFTGSQPLFSPGVPASVRAAAAASSSSGASRDSTTSRLTYELKTAFADILNAREAIKLSESTLTRREENLGLLKLKYKAGRESKAALLETEAALKTARWQHGRYSKNLRLLERKLNRLLGRPLMSPAPELIPPGTKELPEDFSALAGILKRHYSVRAARAALDSARAARESAGAARLPEASANGSYRWSGSDWPDRSNSWSLGASLSLPLFSGGTLRANSAAADKALLSAEADLKASEDAVLLAAEDAFLSWKEAGDYLDVSKSSMEAAEARAWLVRTQYLSGQASYFEWRNVEEQLINAQNQHLAAGRELAVSRAALDRALGE